MVELLLVCLVVAGAGVGLTVYWFREARRVFSPPPSEEVGGELPAGGDCSGCSQGCRLADQPGYATTVCDGERR